jgi:hypothetical protein
VTPLDVIANAIRASCTPPIVPGFAEGWAKVAAEALTDDRIINHAIAAVRAHTWTAGDVEDLTDRDLRAVLRVAFGSITQEASCR